VSLGFEKDVLNTISFQVDALNLQKWSRGKRVAEKDEYIRGRWFATVRAPSLDSQKASVPFVFYLR